MIRARFYVSASDSGVHLLMEGHAGGGPKGKDLVCAAVSALAHTLGEAVERMYDHQMLSRRPRINLNDGEAEIIAVPKPEFGQEVLLAYWVIEAGLHALVQSFPKSIRIEQTIKVKGE